MPTNIVSSICDDRGEEPTYNGVDMSTLIEGECSRLSWKLKLHTQARCVPSAFQ